MSFVNHLGKEIICKIIYFGPSMSGKTTNVKYIADYTRDIAKGKFINLESDDGKTLFFDFLPITLGKVGEYNIKFHLYTFPGHILYDSSKKLILKGVDAIIFVADSSPYRFEANIENLNTLVKTLHVMNIDLKDVIFVFQYNKRDVKDAISVDKLRATLNKFNSLEFEAIAKEGKGVFETLKETAKLLMTNIRSSMENLSTNQ